MFELKFDDSEFAAATLRMDAAYQQMPFAMMLALNDAMFETKQVLTDVTWPKAVHVRNTNFLDWALHINKATDKHNIRAEIFDNTPDQRAHLSLHADGGTKVGKGANLAIPTSNVHRGATGAVASQRPRSLANSVRVGNKIYQQQGKGKNRKLVLMYVLKPSIQQPKDVPFREDFADAIKESALRHFPARMMQAMKTAR